MLIITAEVPGTAPLVVPGILPLVRRVLPAVIVVPAVLLRWFWRRDFLPGWVLLPVRGVPAVCGLLAALDSAGVDRVVVVTGFESGRLQSVVEAAGAAAVYNGRFKEGMFTSIQAGVEAVRRMYGKVGGVLLMKWKTS